MIPPPPKRLAVNADHPSTDPHCPICPQAILHALGDRVPVHLRSGGDDLTRSNLRGTQEFDTDKTLWPVNKAIPKLEAQIQTSGGFQNVIFLGILCFIKPRVRDV